MDEDNKPDRGNNPKGFPFNYNNRYAVIFLIGLVLFFSLFFIFESGDSLTSMPYSTFYAYLVEGQIDTVKILDYHRIEGTLRGSGFGGDKRFITEIPYPDEDLMPLLREHGVVVQGGRQAPSIFDILIQTVPWLIGFFLIWFMFRQVQGGGKQSFFLRKKPGKTVSGE